MPDVLTIELPRPIQAVGVVGDAGDLPETAAPEPTAQQVHEAVECERQELVRTAEALRSAAGDLVQLRQKVVADAEAHLLDLAVAIASRILRQEIDAERYRPEPIIRDALGRVPCGGNVVVHLNPADLARYQALAKADESASLGDAQLVADPQIGRAECLVETEEGILEARLDDQLAEAAKALKQTE